MTENSEAGAEVSPELQAFLAQPEYHAGEDVEEARSESTSGAVEVSDGRSRLARGRTGLRHFLFEKSPSGYSSIAPRLPDGRRSKIFFFNGNGRGR